MSGAGFGSGNIFWRCVKKFWFTNERVFQRSEGFSVWTSKIQILADYGLLITLDVKSMRLLACSASLSFMRSETIPK